MNVVVTESASDDIAETSLFYEMQQEGLGRYFESSIFADIRSLQIYSGIHEIHFLRYHRMIANRFPHGIFYRVEDDAIRVYAVLDTRRDPDWIEERMN